MAFEAHHARRGPAVGGMRQWQQRIGFAMRHGAIGVDESDALDDEASSAGVYRGLDSRPPLASHDLPGAARARPIAPVAPARKVLLLIVVGMAN